MQLARPLFAVDPRRFAGRRVREAEGRSAIGARDTQAVRGHLFRRLRFRFDPDTRLIAGEVEFPAEPGGNEAHGGDEQQLSHGADTEAAQRERDQ